MHGLNSLLISQFLEYDDSSVIKRYFHQQNRMTRVQRGKILLMQVSHKGMSMHALLKAKIYPSQNHRDLKGLYEEYHYKVQPEYRPLIRLHQYAMLLHYRPFEERFSLWLSQATRNQILSSFLFCIK